MVMIINYWSRGEMDITRVFGTWIWGSNPYETAKIMKKINMIFKNQKFI